MLTTATKIAAMIGTTIADAAFMPPTTTTNDARVSIVRTPVGSSRSEEPMGESVPVGDVESDPEPPSSGHNAYPVAAADAGSIAPPNGRPRSLRTMPSPTSLVVSLLVLTCGGWSLPMEDAGSDVSGIPRMRPVREFENVRLKRPVQIVTRADRPGELYVLEQPGRIVVLDRRNPDATEVETFLDIRPEVRKKNNEEGLLYMAFYPDVAEDGTVYLYNSASSPRRTVLSRFTIAENAAATAETEEVLLDVPQPFGNHNGGTVLVGPDGMLYLSIGDGAARGSPSTTVRIWGRCSAQ